MHISARVDGISMHWEISNVWLSPGGGWLSLLSPLLQKELGVTGAGWVCCLWMEWELLKVNDHNNTGLWGCLQSFFLIIDHILPHLMPSKSPVQRTWGELSLSAKHPIGYYWQKKYAYFHFIHKESEVQRGEESCPRSHSCIVDESGLDSTSILLLPRLRVCLSQSIIGIQPWNGCWGREWAELVVDTGTVQRVCGLADAEGLHNQPLLLSPEVLLPPPCTIHILASTPVTHVL